VLTRLRPFLGDVRVLVCTDHLSRGLDMNTVRHVVQAEFATNVVQYIHRYDFFGWYNRPHIVGTFRIGRCSRAGRTGRATNFYDSLSAELMRRIKNTQLPRLPSPAAQPAYEEDMDNNIDVAPRAQAREVEFEARNESDELTKNQRGQSDVRTGSTTASVRAGSKDGEMCVEAADAEDGNTLANAFSRRRGIRRSQKRYQRAVAQAAEEK
jgi:superfamily II DNA/RNA helicase